MRKPNPNGSPKDSGVESPRQRSFANEAVAQQWMLAEVDDPCVDGHRFAYLDDEAALTAYSAIAHNGCCGFFDETIVVNGRAAKIGCNYGH